MSRIIWMVLIAAAFVAGIALSTRIAPRWTERKESTSANVLLERIDKVAKLVTIDAHFSEVYDYKDYYGVDWSIFRKKALVRVKAKVSVGYDLGRLDLEARSDDRMLIVRHLPRPEILSVEHTIDYYDLTAGTFNTFKREDLNKLNEQARGYIVAAALESDMLKQAETRGAEVLEAIRFIVVGSGWTMVVEQSEVEAVSSTLLQ